MVKNISSFKWFTGLCSGVVEKCKKAFSSRVDSRSPELIDLHFNGLQLKNCQVNCSFWDCPSDDEILQLRKYLYEHGIKAFLPTLITDSPAAIEQKLEIIAKHKQKFHGDQKASAEQGLAYISGVHIEGGYISRTGSHPKEFQHALNPELADKLAQKFPGLIKLWTICPLVDKDGRHVAVQRKHGITPSYGHSTANYQEAMDAFDKHGVRLVTHWGNGMDIFLPREVDGKTIKYNREEPSEAELKMLDSKSPDLLRYGALGKAAYDHPEVMMMAICGRDEDQDYHISPKLIQKLAKTGRLILVTDAVARHAGTISNSGCQARGYALAGGRAALDQHVLNARNLAGLSAKEVHQATVTNPAKVLAA